MPSVIECKASPLPRFWLGSRFSGKHERKLWSSGLFLCSVDGALLKFSGNASKTRALTHCGGSSDCAPLILLFNRPLRGVASRQVRRGQVLAGDGFMLSLAFASGCFGSSGTIRKGTLHRRRNRSGILHRRQTSLLEGGGSTASAGTANRHS